jgi:hypothetical protein
MDREKSAIIFYVIVSLVSIVVLIVLLSRKKKNCEGFRKCICSSDQGGRERECQDTVKVNNLYVNNELTEFSKLPEHGWSSVSPGDSNFPISQGCTWPDDTGKGWQKWDFTDFGS